jgi:two-component system NtrC family sensor kinase
MDIFSITDSRGRVIVRAANPQLHGDDVSADNCVARVLETHSPLYGPAIIEPAHLIREGQDRAPQAPSDVIATPRARPLEKKTEERAMAIKAAYPIFSGGAFIGVIYGAIIINKNYAIVDQIKSLVFKDERIDGFELGTATIFLDDLRISTNVEREDGTRSIGTRVSEEVYDKVFLQHELWLDKAFVVNTWYISAYVPIYDVLNQAIGILYVGVLEKKYTNIRVDTTRSFLVALAFSALLALALSAYLIRDIIRPINILIEASRTWPGGT